MYGRGAMTRRGARELEEAREVIDAEARALARVSARLSRSFPDAVDALARTKGRVVTTAMGKPGFIAQKLSATLASVGVPSLYLHPAEAVHGDLGRVAPGDVVVALSNSGATEELLRLTGPLKRAGATLVVITGEGRSPLAKAADVVLDIGAIDEACPMGLVPTASTAALLAVSDALALALARRKRVTTTDYARFHPGGTLGRSVMKVAELMRTGDATPRVRDGDTLREVVVVMTNTPGRPGAACVVDAKGRLTGIFTDGDLRRLAERGALVLERPVREVMARRPRAIGPDALARVAATLMRRTHVDQLPVVDVKGRLVGLLDVQDLLAARLV